MFNYKQFIHNWSTKRGSASTEWVSHLSEVGGQGNRKSRQNMSERYRTGPGQCHRPLLLIMFGQILSQAHCHLELIAWPITFSDNLTDFDFIVFTDPQFGKSDKEMGVTEDGTDWSMDIDNITKMCSQLNKNLAFIMCTGDLAHAMPVDEGQNNAGSLPALRPAQVRF